MTKKMEVGRNGEDLAADYLIRNGCRILARNYRVGFDEIDIIAHSMNGMLIFCEVKTFACGANDSKFGLTPEDNLTDAKFKKISRACEVFVAKHQDLINEEIGWRIDCAIVRIGTGDYHSIKYYKNI